MRRNRLEIDEHPDGTYRGRLATLDEIKAAQPWYRRAWAFVTDAHKFLITFASICTATVAAHAWIAGLVTKKNVKDEVTTAVVAAMFEMRSDISDLKDRTAGLPDWRRTTQETIVRHEERIEHTSKQEEKLEARFDWYLRHR